MPTTIQGIASIIEGHRSHRTSSGCALLRRVVVAFLLSYPPTLHAQWRVDAKPTLDIAATSTQAVRFGSATGAAVLRDGGVAIADNLDGAIHLFDAAGRHLRTIGRRGSGPGEFQLISWLGNCGADSLFVWDFGLRRMSILSGSGQVVAQYTLPLRSEDGAAPYVLACSRKGAIVALQSPTRLPPPRAGEHGARGTAKLIVMNSRGSVGRVLGEVATHEYAVDRSGALLPRPLGKATHVAISDSRVFVASGESPDIDVFTLGPGRAHSISLHATVRPATERHLSASITQLVAYANDPAIRERMMNLLREIRPPPHLPFYSGIFTDPAGYLWVSVSAPGDSTLRLHVYSPSGTLASLVELPVPLKVFEVGESYVLGHYEALSGEQHVAVFRVFRR